MYITHLKHYKCSKKNTRTHARTHARTRARTHARTHTLRQTNNTHGDRQTEKHTHRKTQTFVSSAAARCVVNDKRLAVSISLQPAGRGHHMTYQQGKSNTEPNSAIGGQNTKDISSAYTYIRMPLKCFRLGTVKFRLLLRTI